VALGVARAGIMSARGHHRHQAAWNCMVWRGRGVDDEVSAATWQSPASKITGLRYNGGDSHLEKYHQA